MAIKINYDEAEAQGWVKEQLDELKRLNYLRVQPTDNVYDWMNDVCLALIKGEKPPIDEMNFCGGRNSRKTFLTAQLCALFMAISIKYDRKVAVWGFRWLGSDVNDLRQEFQQAIDTLGLKQSKKKTSFGDAHYMFKNANNKPRWDFIGGSFINLRGIHNSRNTKISLKGLSRANDFDWGVSFCDEANEFDNSEFQAIDFAVRGIKHYLKIKASNPDNEYQDYIKYCSERVPFNERELDENGYQFKIVKELGKTKLFEYANYQINPYLTEAQVNEFKELKVLDPIKYKIWGLGMPGKLEASIFGHYMNQIQAGDNFVPTYFAGGIDFGQSDAPTGHPTTMEIVGIDELNRVKVVNEYFHSNATQEHLSPIEMAREIVETTIKPINELEELLYKSVHQTGKELEETNKRIDYLDNMTSLMRSQGLKLYCDYGGGGKPFGDIIQRCINEEYPEYASFISIDYVEKDIYEVKDRVDITIAMITQGMLFINKETAPNLIKQMNIMEWKVPSNDSSSHKLIPIDLNDDCWDALMYAIMKIAKKIIDSMRVSKPLFTPKGRI